jgi:hypothetical protein
MQQQEPIPIKALCLYLRTAHSVSSFPKTYRYDLAVNYGGKVTANSATANSMIVNGSVVAYRGAMIQNGVVGLGGSATTDVEQACELGSVLDFCIE